MKVLAPSLFNTEATLHVNEIQELLFGQGTFASHDIFMGCPGHRLGKRPLTHATCNSLIRSPSLLNYEVNKAAALRQRMVREEPVITCILGDIHQTRTV